jgi:IS30 family transposase
MDAAPPSGVYTGPRRVHFGNSSGPAELDAVAVELNLRPHKRLAFANPSEQLAELLLQ